MKFKFTNPTALIAIPNRIFLGLKPQSVSHKWTFNALIITLFSITIGLFWQNNSQANHPSTQSLGSPILPTEKSKPLMTGAARFSEYLWRLKNRRVMVVANQTSIVGNTHLVDTLIKLGIKVVGVFAPEHGFRGDAANGEHINNQIDTKTGLPIYSLYGKNYKPSSDQLSKADVVLFDIQDVGARFYTYLTTMHFVMQACAENNKQLIVLDRPNPNGYFIDGPILESENISMVGIHPIPLVHGMTLGEMAYMIIGEKWLALQLPSKNPVIPKIDYTKLNVIVVSCSNWIRENSYQLPVAPSPNLPNQNAIYLYPTLGMFEGTVMSMGRGTTKPFECFGAPWLKQGNYQFTPVNIPGKAVNPPYLGKECRGVLLEDFGTGYLKSSKHLYIEWLVMLKKECPDSIHFFLPFFTKLVGTKKFQKLIEQGKSAQEIRKTWETDLANFELKRKKYLLYP